MITFSRLGKKGNLGNQLFQVASTIGLAHKHNHSYIFPPWQPAQFFEFEFPTGNTEGFQRLHEKHFHYHDWKIRDGNFDIFGYLQSEKYFSQNFTKKIFNIIPAVHKTVLEKQKLYGKPENIFISVRRGDFVHHPWFYQLSYKYYLGALFSYFPDWESRNIIFSSDDIEYCKFHFSFLPNAYFLENLSPIEQLAFATSCNDFIISNSTFSWWLAWLGEKSDSKIIRPLKNFRSKHSRITDEKDYFPNRWLIFNHERYLLPRKYIKIMVRGELYHSRSVIKHFLSQSLEKLKKIFTHFK